MRSAQVDRRAACSIAAARSTCFSRTTRSTRGYKVTLFTYNLEIFDPTWFALPSRRDPRASSRRRPSEKKWRRLQAATRGYDEFLRLGGSLKLRDLDPSLLRKYLKRGTPVITGLSATYLYRAVRDIAETNVDDDIRGEPVGHFVVLTGYRRHPREMLIADPLRATRSSVRAITRSTRTV